KDFETLLINYKTCFFQLEKIKIKAKKVTASEKVVSDRLIATTATTIEMNENEKLCQTLNKLKFEVDAVLQKCIQDEKQTRQAVQHYIHNNMTDTDQHTLTRLITSLFDTLVELNQQEQHEEQYDNQQSEQEEQVEEKEQDKMNPIHSWILQLSTNYIKTSPTIKDQEFIIQQLMRTKHISNWAIPLIQLNYHTVTDLSCVHDYTHALSIILFSKKKKWTEDDYLAVLDQLDISTTFNRILSHSSKSLSFSIELQDILIKATIIHNVHHSLHHQQHGTNQLLNTLVDKLLDIDKIPSGWFFLSTLPFRELSVHTVWHLLCKILGISTDQPILDDTLALDISSFIERVHQHPTQGQPLQNQFARYIIDNLDLGYTTTARSKEEGVLSQSQPWHRRNPLFLTSEIHEQLGFVLLSACYHHVINELDNKEAEEDNIAHYIPFIEQEHHRQYDHKQMEMINWAWGIATKLKLYDCPVSARLETQIHPTFLKRLLHHPNNLITLFGALIVYISFLLSATSRHFLQFESMDGWLKLFIILKKGKGGIIQILSETIPSFVYMHGDDFFNDEQNLLDFIKHTEYIFSSNGGGGLSLVMGSHLWQARFIDSQNKDLCSNGFSYFDLMLHSWLKTLFRQHEWMLDEAYLSLVDCLCKMGVLFHSQKMVQRMLTEETHRRLEYQKQLKQRNNSPKIARLFKSMFFDDDHNDSLLVMMDTTTKKQQQQQHVWFTFDVLLLETVMEVPLQQQVAETVKQYVENPKTPSFLDYFDITTATNYKKKPIDSFLIYRWLKHLIHVPVGHSLTPLFLQVIFTLYFAGVSIAEGRDIVYGHVFFTQKLDLKLQLRNYLLECRKYHHEATLGYNETKDISSLYSLYNAMLNWLDNPAILDPKTDLRSLPPHYLIDRLEQCYKIKDLAQLDDMLWMDLIHIEFLQDSFTEFPWCGSEKFTSVIMEEDQRTIASSVITTKRPYCNVVLPLPEINT
ncbi:hypothetical protein K501DRAFT_200969, partial [Backusella circina FSU 941]